MEHDETVLKLKILEDDKEREERKKIDKKEDGQHLNSHSEQIK